MSSTLEAVIFDWAGTIVDFGSFAPTQIFVDAFRQAYGFELTLAQARAPMGLGKWQHIEAIGNDPDVARDWVARFGHPMGKAEINHIYETFLPLQVERVGDHAAFVPGALEAVTHARQLGLKVGSTTGYPRVVMRRLMEVAAANGYSPDCTLCADDLPAGARPGPWMALECVQRLAVGDVAHCVKVDDTVPGLLEGKRAGMWTVGVALSGSPAGWTLDAYRAASAEARQQMRAKVGQEFAPTGNHYTIDTVADLPAVLQAIEARLARGERP